MNEEANIYHSSNLPRYQLAPYGSKVHRLLSLNKKSLNTFNKNNNDEQNCIKHECANNKNRVVSLMRAPPIFSLSPPPNPLIYLDIDDLYDLDVSLLVLTSGQTKNTDTNQNNENIFSIHSKLTNENFLPNENCRNLLSTENFINKNNSKSSTLNNDQTFSQSKNFFVNNLNASDFNRLSNSTFTATASKKTYPATAIAVAAGASSTPSNSPPSNNTNYLSLFLFAAFSIITVLLVFVFVYIYFSRRNSSIRKQKKLQFQGYTQQTTQSASLLDKENKTLHAYLTSTHHPNHPHHHLHHFNNLNHFAHQPPHHHHLHHHLIQQKPALNLDNNYNQFEQYQNLIQPTSSSSSSSASSSSSSSNNQKLQLIDHQNHTQSMFPCLITGQTRNHQHQVHYMTVDCKEKLAMPVSTSFVACEWLSLSRPNNANNQEMPPMLNLANTFQQQEQLKSVKNKSKKDELVTKKKNKIFFKKNNSTKSNEINLLPPLQKQQQKSLLQPLIEPCTCSTTSTAVNTVTTTTSSSAASFSSSSASSTANRPDLDNFTDNHPLSNHYQKLFFKPNEASASNDEQTKLYNNLNKLSGKVALLCNTDSNQPKIVQILDLNNQDSLLIPKFYECFKMLNVNVNNNENHYENNNLSEQLKSKMDDASNEEVYELIDDNVIESQMTHRQMNQVKLTTFNSSRQTNLQSGANFTLGNKKKYPKTNPNYTHNNNNNIVNDGNISRT